MLSEPVLILLTFTLLIILGGILIAISIHLFPCAQSGVTALTPGIPTGPPMMSLGVCIIGIIVAAYSISQNYGFTQAIFSSAVTSALGLSITMVMANVTYAFGVGTVICNMRRDPDIFTGWKQHPYTPPDGYGCGVPVQMYVSGILASIIGGIGGAMVLYGIYQEILPFSRETALDVAGVLSFGVFLTVAVLATYVLQGNSDGFIHKEKMQRLPTTILSCAILTTMYAIVLAAATHLNT
jgi:N5-methyltetrahydromethanopterin:coenzyme M methyltransferase subunit D